MHQTSPIPGPREPASPGPPQTRTGKNRALEVAVAAPVFQTLSYLPPEHGADDLLPGRRLLVPLGNRLVTGYLLGDAPEPPAGQTVKRVAEVLDAGPLFPAGLIPFYRWIASYYQYPIGEVIKSALPGGLAPKSCRQVLLTPAGREPLSRQAADSAPAWLADLLRRGALTAAATRALWRQPAERRLLESWAASGWLRIQEEVSRDRVKPRTELLVRLAGPQTSPPAELKLSERKTLDTLRTLAAESGREWVSRRELARLYSSARKALPPLLDLGLILQKEQPLYRDPFGEPPPFYPTPEQLSPEQETVLAELLPAVELQRFATFLLHGITGSGKTEIYLRAAAAALAANRSVLVLVPEIALATQLEGHFISRFGQRVALLHSGLSAGERYDQWQRLAAGEAMVVIGARSAIFAPLAAPGLLIVDEEHDGAYKQEDGLRYQARDLAVLRGSLQQAVVLLGSATPSLASFFHARQNKYRLLTMTRRVADRSLPAVEIVDLRQTRTVSGRPPLFTPPLFQALRENLARGEQSLVFLNRRGFAPQTLCHQCGHTLQCRHCQVSLTLHQGRKELLCHYCGYTLPGAQLCPNCQSPDLLSLGFGTERVASELARLFPTARIDRLDRDTATNRRDYLNILKKVRDQETEILIGTQMITKGHHFPHVTLVGVVWADASLGVPDFKAGERTFQILSQVTGRTGRGEKPGRVIVQTFQPEHYSIATARDHDYFSFYDRELALRRQLGYPPFSRLINFRLEGETETAVQEVAERLAAAAREFAGPGGNLEILGPVPAPLARLRGKYRWQLLLKSARGKELHLLCARLRQQGFGRAGNVKLTVDVDPDNML